MILTRLKALALAAAVGLLPFAAMAAPAVLPMVKNTAGQPIQTVGTVCVDATGTYTGCGAPEAPLTPCLANAASSVVCKSTPGNVFTGYLTSTADSWLYVFNATTAPTSPSAVTAGSASGNYQECIKVPNGTSGSFGGLPVSTAYSVGIVAAISSTACGTFTAATTGFIHVVFK